MIQPRAILVLNAGSSSIKFSTFRLAPSGLDRQVHGQVSGLATEPKLTLHRSGKTLLDTALGERASSHALALEALLEQVQAHLEGHHIVGVGHRVVHGGREFVAPVVIDDGVLQRLERYVPLAPLHQPHNLATIRVMLERLRNVPEIACFDTAFHRSMPEVAQRYALPARCTEAGIRRYGFHGLSYEYIAGELATLDPRAAAGRTVVLHLGNGASMCALTAGRSVATTMGFTALDGLPMGTRCGSLDPGVMLYLMDAWGLQQPELEQLLYHESGLLGVSGVSSDVRDLLKSQSTGAREALDLFVYRAGLELGSLAAALDGLDAIVFTAGIGENQPEIRARIAASARWLGVELDEAANTARGPRISTPNSAVAAWVVPTDEELMIARHVASAIGVT